MAEYKFKDENNNWQRLVQDVKVNDNSVFDGINADIKLKTINNQSIIGTGNITIQGGEGEYVKYTPDQNLTSEQQTNARNNINAFGNNQVKQNTGASTTNVMSQKATTDALNLKQNEKPDGRHNLINNDGKLANEYMPYIEIPVRSVNGETGDVSITCDNIDAVYKYQGWDNKHKNVVTNEYGEISLGDYPTGQIIVELFRDLPTENIQEKTEATVLDSMDEYHYYTDDEFQNSYDNSEPLADQVKIRYAPEQKTVIGQELTLQNNDYTMYAFYNDNFTENPCFVLRITDMNTLEEAYYFFSWTEQYFIPNNNIKLYANTWTKIWQDSNDAWHGETANYDEIPIMYYPVYVDTIVIEPGENFCENFFYMEHKNPGRYVYEKVEPYTDPITYYWKYSPLQSNWEQEYPSESDYIRNKPEIYPYNEHIWTRGNIRAFGTDYTNSKEVVMTYEMTINRASVPEWLRIPDDDLIWIRQYVPKFIQVKCTSKDYVFTLNYASSSMLEYVLLQNEGGYAYLEYYLRILNTDTYSSGCLVQWSASTAMPSANILSNNKTYTGQYVNGSLKWTEALKGTPGVAPKRKNITQLSTNIREDNGVVTITDIDITATGCMVTIYPTNAATETWLNANMSSKIITYNDYSFSFNIDSSLPATYAFYYIITKYEV